MTETVKCTSEPCNYNKEELQDVCTMQIGVIGLVVVFFIFLAAIDR